MWLASQGRPGAEGVRGWWPGEPRAPQGRFHGCHTPARVAQDTRGQKVVSEQLSVKAEALGRLRDGVTSWLGCQCLRYRAASRAKRALPEREVNTQTCFLSLTTFSDLSDHPSQGTRSKWEKQHFPHKGIHRCKSKPVILSSFAP